MKDINSVVIFGRITRDAELQYTSGGYAILNFSIATNRSVKKNDEWQDEVSYFNAAMFGKRAEGVAQYMLKGKQIAILGNLKQDRWEQDGQKRSIVKIMVDKIQFIGGKKQEAVRTVPAAQAEPVTEENFKDDMPF